MKIGIDCRLYGPKHTGIGRYVQNLVENLLEQDKENEYVLFFNKGSRREFENSRSPGFARLHVFVNVKHYSLKEQFLLSGIIQREGIALMHFPHFNVPVFYRGKYVVTIHDLIKHTSKGAETTTRTRLLYWLKYFGYKIVFRRAVKRAEKIITPSNFVKDELIKEYGLNPDKVVVTYEGVDSSIKYQACLPARQVLSIKEKDNLLDKYNIKKPYLLYVGSVYPHKNVNRLIDVVKMINSKPNTQRQTPIPLVIVCARNVFRERLSNYIEQSKSSRFVMFTNYVTDEELAVLYQEAEVFVFPTLSEGFGLPGLEAMAMGCPVICSGIPVLKEVYNNAAVYFNPLDSEEIAQKIKSVMDDEKIKERLRNFGFLLVKRYSWEKTAKQTLQVYRDAQK